jgi:D-alanyl-D-alanine carboxypeptidase (penicillin-binding protein 5/6)
MMNAETGQILFEKGARTPIYPASTMKVATILNVLEKASDRLDEKVIASQESLRRVSEKEKVQSGFTLPPYILEHDGKRIGIREGEIFSVRGLLSATIIYSANDACNVLADTLSPSISDFVSEMNELAKRLGCKNTHFCNPHGLHQPDHVSSSYDMALITREALKYPLFLELIGETSYIRPKSKLQPAKEFLKTPSRFANKESPYYYPKATVIKTGYHWRAKHNVIVWASNGERRVLVALHKSPTVEARHRDAIALFESAFSEAKIERPIFRKGEMKFEKKIPKGKTILSADFLDDIYFECFPSEEPILHTKLVWYNLTLPILAGTEVGEVLIFDVADKCLKKEPIFAKKTVEKRNFYWVWFLIFTLGVVSALLWAVNYRDKIFFKINRLLEKILAAIKGKIGVFKI